MTRSRKMAATVAAAIGLGAAALVPAGAGAATGCHIKLNAVAPRLVQAGETALLFGQIRCVPGGLAAGQTVSYFERVAGGSVTPIGTSSSDTLGKFQLTTPALEKNTYFYVGAAGAQSGRRLVTVSPKVTISGPPDGSVLYTGRGPIIHRFGTSAFPSKVTFSGKVSPTLAGDEVVLQRENAITGEQWHRIGHGSFVSSTGAYTIEHTFVVPGAANIRVLVRRTKVSARGVSEALSYEILQAQNPELTIFSSKNPVFYGEPVTINGEDKAGPGVKLTLLSRTASARKFKEVTTTMTTTGGSYTFPAQTALQNTSYKVVAAGPGSARSRNSAALFEGVKYLLTAEASTMTPTQGMPVVFSGTVTPAVAGHPVYLQVQNPSGIGFHVVNVGAVTSGGTYSITYVPFVPGVRTYRVRVPGDPINAGAGSGPITITTSAAPASAINPEPPGNSTPPNEGH